MRCISSQRTVMKEATYDSSRYKMRSTNYKQNDTYSELSNGKISVFKPCDNEPWKKLDGIMHV